MQTWEPMVTCAKLSIQTSSPIQQWSPIVRYQGNLTLTPGLMYAPLPTLAPKIRSTNAFNLGTAKNLEETNGEPEKCQRSLSPNERPLSNSELSGIDRSIRHSG